MNLQPVPVDDIPIGKPLPWRLYDPNGYIVFARGEMVTSRDQLESLLGQGLFRDTDAPQQTRERLLRRLRLHRRRPARDRPLLQRRPRRHRGADGAGDSGRPDCEKADVRTQRNASRRSK